MFSIEERFRCLIVCDAERTSVINPLFYALVDFIPHLAKKTRPAVEI